jgi:hypothetical protein
MAIEIRQLVVKSNLVQPPREAEPVQQKVDLENLRQSVLAECRELIVEALRETRER